MVGNRLLNYTTDVPMQTTIGEIMGMLAAHGCQQISIDYDERQQPAALRFLLNVALGELRCVMPMRMPAVLKILEGLSKQRKPVTRANRNVGDRVLSASAVTPERAYAVGWRVVKDWVEAQLALIDIGLATLDQVMLPYATDATGQTLYDLVSKSGALALPRSATGPAIVG